MNGRSSLRGYLLQTLVCLLGALRTDSKWESLALEPHLDSDKVDIVWYYADGEARVTQVKSSQNQIGRRQVREWAAELEASILAGVYELILIGPCAQTVVDLEKVGNVLVPSPQPLDVEGLIEQAAHRLDMYLEVKGPQKIGATAREVLVKALATQLEVFSTGAPLSRSDFEHLLDGWIATAISQLTELSAEQLSRLKARAEALLRESPQIESLYLDHPDVKSWRTTARRYFGDVDRILPGNNYVLNYDYIAWHPPDTPARDTPEQRKIYARACANTEGLLKGAIQQIEESLEEMQGPAD